MMPHRLQRIAAAAIVLLGAAAWAYNGMEIPGDGPYSTSMDNLNEGAPDPAIPGFVGPDGDGMCLEDGPDNVVNPRFLGWAATVIDYSPSDAVGSYGYNSIGNGFDNPYNTLGPVTGDNFHIASLGDMDEAELSAGGEPGSITLGFDLTIVDGPGPDLAVFENGFISAGGAGVNGQIFGELGFLEVSTDGETFLRFPGEYLADSGLVGAYGTVEATCIRNLVGKHVNAYGMSWATPFDLAELADAPEVLAGLVDLGAIHYVRVVDIPGSGDVLDADGRPIYDAWVTWGSGGLDLEAVGVLNHSLSVLPGDADGDDHVNVNDFIILKRNYNRSGLGWDCGDFNHDGQVNIGDFILLKQNYGR